MKEVDAVQAYALTDVGKYRSMNQDYIYASTVPVGWEVIRQEIMRLVLPWKIWSDILESRPRKRMFMES